MNELFFKKIIAKRIMLLNGLLFIILGVMYLLDGFTPGTAPYLIGILLPNTTVYIGSVLDFKISDRYITLEEDQYIERYLKRSFVEFSKRILSLHFLTLIILIVFSASFKNLINDHSLKFLFTIEEAFFGIGAAKIISISFPKKSK